MSFFYFPIVSSQSQDQHFFLQSTINLAEEYQQFFFCFPYFFFPYVLSTKKKYGSIFRDYFPLRLQFSYVNS